MGRSVARICAQGGAEFRNPLKICLCTTDCFDTYNTNFNDLRCNTHPIRLFTRSDPNPNIMRLSFVLLMRFFIRMCIRINRSRRTCRMLRCVSRSWLMMFVSQIFNLRNSLKLCSEEAMDMGQNQLTKVDYLKLRQIMLHRKCGLIIMRVKY